MSTRSYTETEQINLITCAFDESSRPMLRVIAQGKTQPGAGPGATARVIFGTLLVDTGSAQTVVDRNWIRQLGLVHLPETRAMNMPFSGAGKIFEAPQFDISIFIPNRQVGDGGSVGPGLWLESMRVPAIDFSLCRHNGVIGRDVLGTCTFAYFGEERKFSLAY